MLLKKLILPFFIGTLLLMSQQSFAQSTSIPESERPDMVVISANYGLLLGYAFYIEFRGAKRTGRKEIYKKLESEIIDMGNPSDAMNFMNDSGYDLLDAYSFPKDSDGGVTVNYIFKKRNDN